MAVKLPDFWTGDPETWFATVEAQLCRGRILEEMTMFNHMVAKLPPDVVAAVRDIPLAPPLNEPYKTLKTRRVSSFAPSKWDQVSRLLHFPDLVDRRPKALMDAMLASLPTGASSNCELFQGIFLEPMPDYIRMHLSLPIFETAQKMTIMADVLWA